MVWNYAKDVRLVGAKHVKESNGQTGQKMTNAAFRQFTLGYYGSGADGSGFENANFAAGGVTGTTKRVPAAPWNGWN